MFSLVCVTAKMMKLERVDVLCEEMVMRLSLHTSPLYYCYSFLFFIFNPTPPLNNPGLWVDPG